jgi:hypothetical protein
LTFFEIRTWGRGAKINVIEENSLTEIILPNITHTTSNLDAIAPKHLNELTKEKPRWCPS